MTYQRIKILSRIFMDCVRLCGFSCTLCEVGKRCDVRKEKICPLLIHGLKGGIELDPPRTPLWLTWVRPRGFLMVYLGNCVLRIFIGNQWFKFFINSNNIIPNELHFMAFVIGYVVKQRGEKWIIIFIKNWHVVNSFIKEFPFIFNY